MSTFCVGIERSSSRIAFSAIALVLTLIVSAAHANPSASIEELFSLISQGNVERAQSKTNQLLKQYPEDPELRFAEALIAEKQGDNPKAIRLYENLIASNPKMLEPLNNLAVLHANTGDFEAAIRTLERAITIQPSVAVAYKNLTSIYARMASAAYRKALDSDAPVAPLQLASIDSVEPNIDTNADEPPTLVASVENFVNESIQESGSQQPQADSEQLEQPETAETASNTDQSPATEPTPDPVSQPVIEVVEVAVAQSIDPPVAEDKAPQPQVEAPDPVVASTSNTAEAKKAIENNAANKQALINHIKSWANAWSERDVDRYLSHYSNSFVPRDNLSLDDWKQQRHGRLRWRKFIVVKPSKYSINIDGNKARVNFSQYYKSDRFEDTIRKTLEFKKEGDQWLITRELI